jgi:hypothetical protein
MGLSDFVSSTINLFGPFNDFRSTSEFAYHGNWCGPGWTGGHWEEYTPHSDPDYYQPPVDMLDKACKTHDMCYYQCRQDFPCSISDRSACMKQCDLALASAAFRMNTPDGISIAGKDALATIIKYQSPDAGANASFCPMPPSNSSISQFFNGW